MEKGLGFSGLGFRVPKLGLPFWGTILWSMLGSPYFGQLLGVWGVGTMGTCT